MMNRIVIEEEDRYSMYSFDSVSTNGRLLDRLDFGDEEDDDDIEEVVDDFDYRGELQSVISNEDGWDMLDNSHETIEQNPEKDPSKLSLRSTAGSTTTSSSNQNPGSPSIPPRSTNRPIGSFARISGRILDGGTRSHMNDRNGRNRDFITHINTRDKFNPNRGINDGNRQTDYGHRLQDQDNLANGNGNPNRNLFNNSNRDGMNNNHNNRNNNNTNIGLHHNFGNQGANHDIHLLRNDVTPGNTTTPGVNLKLNSSNSTMDPGINRGVLPNSTNNASRNRSNSASVLLNTQQDKPGHTNMNTNPHQTSPDRVSSTTLLKTHFSPISKVNNNPNQITPPNPIYRSYSEDNKSIPSNDSTSSIFSSRIQHPTQNKIILQENASVDSFKAGVGTTKPLTITRSFSSRKSPKKIVLEESDLPSKGSLKEHIQSDIPKPTPEHHLEVQRMASNPPRKRSDSVNPIAVKPITPPKRSLSHGSNMSQHSQLPSNNIHDDMAPDSRTKLALQFRNIGKHRDASYQLQIAASPPYNYPKAMYLYSIALKQGQGVKKNDRQYLKWLSKCILLFSNPIGLSDIVDKLNSLEPEDLIKLIIRKLKFDTKKDPINNGEDPFELYKNLGKLSKTDILKIANTSKFQSDILAVAYYELGNATMYGWGLNTKSEMVGIKLLGKSAAMGYTTSMVQLGETWSNKSKSHKRDLNKAAAWLRLSELFGVKEIGNSWIYKEKYLVPAKK